MEPFLPFLGVFMQALLASLIADYLGYRYAIRGTPVADRPPGGYAVPRLLSCSHSASSRRRQRESPD
jgi:hypothetical protein